LTHNIPDAEEKNQKELTNKNPGGKKNPEVTVPGTLAKRSEFEGLGRGGKGTQ